MPAHATPGVLVKASESFSASPSQAGTTMPELLLSSASPYTFREVIDADHSTINRLAGRVRKFLASSTVASRLPELNALLLEITWRLIRHDFSEDTVMRPAFASTFGALGTEMAARDRAEHVSGRDLLLNILGEFQSMADERDEGLQRERLEMVARLLTEAFDELAEHMRVESGEFLPHFESVISRDTSLKLAGDYADTLVVTPTLMRCADGGGKETQQAVFKGGVQEYIHTSPDSFQELYLSILAEASSPSGKVWFEKVKQHEIEKVQVDKPQKPRAVVDPQKIKEEPVGITPKVPSNALGLPVSWHAIRKGKL